MVTIPSNKLSMMVSISDDELLFFGSVKVNFAHHPGVVYSYDFDSTDEVRCHIDQDVSESPSVEENPELTNNTNDDQLVLPHIPSSCIQLTPAIGTRGSIPADLQYPLVKTNLPSAKQGVVSGTRSALIKSSTSKWYRMKGCGNDTDGFPIRAIDNFTGKFTIRGCAFRDTAHRELFMTTHLARLFAPHGIDCANTSIGWVEYNRADGQIQSDVPVECDEHLHRWPDIARCCILAETLGNKRLSDHVLYGLEQLLVSIIIAEGETHPVTQSIVIGLFPPERLTKSDRAEKQLVPLSTWFASLADILQPINYFDSDWLARSSHCSDRISSDLEEDRWRTSWTAHIRTINQYLRTHGRLANLLCSLYKRLGFECGSILGLMHHHRISWGTYTDELGVHCNAHPNNLVIKQLSSSTTFLLAPLDFDMSFTERSFRPNDANTTPFDEIMRLELSGFQLTLAGDAESSSGVTAWATMPDDQWTSARWLLRDIMLNEFNVAYYDACQSGCIKPLPTFSEAEDHAIQSLIRLTLLKTMKEVA